MKVGSDGNPVQDVDAASSQDANSRPRPYNPDACCLGGGCVFEEWDDVSRCSGDSEVIDEHYDGDGWTWVHCCEGHKDLYWEKF